VLYHQPNL
jgi:hypothetical protein